MEYDSAISFNAQKRTGKLITHVYTYAVTLIINIKEIYTYRYIYIPGQMVSDPTT